MDIKTVFGILLAGILSNNLAFVGLFGTGSVIEKAFSPKKALKLGLMTSAVMLLSAAITWPLNAYLLADVYFLAPMVSVVVMLVVTWLWSKIFRLSTSDYLRFTLNAAVLALCLNSMDAGFAEAMIGAVAAGLGFTLVTCVYSKLKDCAVDEEAVPKSFRGLPISLLTAGMITLALLALTF